MTAVAGDVTVSDFVGDVTYVAVAMTFSAVAGDVTSVAGDVTIISFDVAAALCTRRVSGFGYVTTGGCCGRLQDGPVIITQYNHSPCPHHQISNRSVHYTLLNKHQYPALLKNSCSRPSALLVICDILDAPGVCYVPMLSEGVPTHLS